MNPLAPPAGYDLKAGSVARSRPSPQAMAAMARPRSRIPLTALDGIQAAMIVNRDEKKQETVPAEGDPGGHHAAVRGESTAELLDDPRVFAARHCIRNP